MVDSFYMRLKHGGKRSLPAMAAAFALLVAHETALAAVGCNPVVLDAMNDKAQAKVAYDTAAVEEIIDKPDSVLAMTCFNQAAGVSASAGGAIFSGDFTTSLQPVIEPALSAFYDDYADSLGLTGGFVDYGATSLMPTYSCNEMEDLWQGLENEGVQAGVPFLTFDDLVTGSAAGGGGDFLNSWNAALTSQNIFADLNAAMGALPAPSAIPGPPPANATACDTLVTYGVMPGPCP
jgi:hypothetical protein